MKELKEKQQSAFKKFKDLWKGDGEQLAKSTWTYVITQDRRSKALSWYGSKKHPRNLRQQFNHLAQTTFDKVIKADKNWRLVVMNSLTGPLWCSEGALDTDACRRLIGHAIKQGPAWLDTSFDQKANDKYIPSGDEDYQYQAYVAKDDGDVKLVNLTNNWSYATSAYNNLFKGGKDREYNIGIIAHSARQGFWHPKSLLTGNEKALDSQALFVKYHQKENKLYSAKEISEKEARLNTTKVVNDNLEKQWKKLKELFTGSGDQLFKRYKFVVVTYHKRARQLSQIYMKDH
jgi:hypothetical protein